MKQIDLEPHEHSTLIEVVKVPKRLFYLVAAMWMLMVVTISATTEMGWAIAPIAAFSVVVGIGWVCAYPETFLKRLRN